MSFTSVIGRSLEKLERLQTLRPYLTTGLPVIGECPRAGGYGWANFVQDVRKAAGASSCSSAARLVLTKVNTSQGNY